MNSVALQIDKSTQTEKKEVEKTETNVEDK